jgi:hypothetical protein
LAILKPSLKLARFTVSSHPTLIAATIGTTVKSWPANALIFKTAARHRIAFIATVAGRPIPVELRIQLGPVNLRPIFAARAGHLIPALTIVSVNIAILACINVVANLDHASTRDTACFAVIMYIARTRSVAPGSLRLATPSDCRPLFGTRSNPC